MKKITAFLMALCLPCMLLAQGTGGPRTISYSDLVTGGSLVVTQAVDSFALELKRLEFTVAEAGATNTFSFAHVRTIKLPDTVTSVVSTSQVINPSTGSGWLETNKFYQSNGAYSFTNNYTFTSTTNVTTPQYFDGDDFGWGLTLEFKDKITYSFSDTNLPFTQVYDLYPRP